MTEYDIGKAFEAIENELISSMMRNMKRHKAQETEEGFAWNMWQTEQLKALAEYKKRNYEIYPKKFAEINEQIEKLIEKAYEEGGLEEEAKILKAIKKGFKTGKKILPKSSVDFFKINDRKLNALIESVTNDMKKAQMAILRMSDDRYRKAIFNAQVYANMGAGTYEKAVDMATKDMLSAGLNCVEYKNGARHTLANYAKMAIRTASKRAYLQGEGAKRQEWGISTVILNKRGNPCPLCLPFVGKVFIDDVWSGGKPEDGSYPLLSQAIEKGLYHPNCRDSHTTYFPGISTMDDGWTDEEKEKLQSEYMSEQRNNYAKRQAERFERLSEYSLDEENKRMYGVRAKQWKHVYSKIGGNAIDDFEAAASIEEAEKYAKQFIDGDAFSSIFKNTASFNGISVESANEINKTLKEIYDRYDIPKISGIKVVSANSAQGKKIFSGSDAVAAYNPVEHGIFINKDIVKNKKSLEDYKRSSESAWDLVVNNIEKLSGKDKQTAMIYVNAGRSIVGDGSLHDYLIHEIGHHVMWTKVDTPTINQLSKRMSLFAPKISGYANSNIKEYFAETFSAFIKGETDRIDPLYIDFLKDVKKHITKPMNYGIINTGARITNAYSKEARSFAKMYYEEIRHFTTDVKRISTNIGKNEADIQKIKSYLFLDKSYYDEDIKEWRRFAPDCAIAQSWQRLMIGKDIKKHDITLIEHELYEMKLKAENSNITHLEAHSMAQSKYNYSKEVEEYYGNLKEHKQK